MVETREHTRARYLWAVLRMSLGWTFLWPFLDKTFGLGFATPSSSAWANGGYPTRGFPSGANNPFLDDHIVYGVALIGLSLTHAGRTWGLGDWWSQQPVVQKHPWLE